MIGFHFHVWTDIPLLYLILAAVHTIAQLSAPDRVASQGAAPGTPTLQVSLLIYRHDVQRETAEWGNKTIHNGSFYGAWDPTG